MENSTTKKLFFATKKRKKRKKEKTICNCVWTGWWWYRSTAADCVNRLHSRKMLPSLVFYIYYCVVVFQFFISLLERLHSQTMLLSFGFLLLVIFPLVISLLGKLDELHYSLLVGCKICTLSWIALQFSQLKKGIQSWHIHFNVILIWEAFK